MTKNARSAKWMLFLFFLAGFAATPPMLAAEKKPDAKSESQKEQDEINRQNEERMTGKEGGYQRQFSGTFMLSDSSQQDNPDVVGVFITDGSDEVPKQGYQVRVAKGDKESEILDALKRNSGKKIEVQGRLRVDNKYLVVSRVIEPSAPPKPPERRAGGGL